MGRWRLDEDKARSWGAGKASVERESDGRWRLRREHGNQPYDSDEPDTGRIWWSDTGVHQNLTFPVQPDPVSGMHCWLQRVTVGPAQLGDAYGDVVVD
ncbi:MAG TPA: formate dehydrogenase, partial [Acidimicrobiaceae bacterium]|nr:formate dehydrogenase [Acidimicrobiaceae bacterium]